MQKVCDGDLTACIKTGRVLFALLLVVGVVGIAAWVILQPREPRYRGKPLSFWLRAFELGNHKGKPNWNEALEAVRDAGTNAIPILLHMLNASDSDWKHCLRRLAQKQHVVVIEYTAADTQQWVARQAFSVLGKLGEAATPELRSMYALDVAHGATNANRAGYIREILSELKERQNDSGRTKSRAEPETGNTR